MPNENITIHEDETLIVFSNKAKEAFLFAVKQKNTIYGICKFTKIDQIKSDCLNAGFPKNFLIENIDSFDKKVFAINDSTKKKFAICAEEKFVENQYKLCLTSLPFEFDNKSELIKEWFF